VNGSRSVDYFHRELGKILWENCGMERSRETLEKALSEIPALRDEFHKDVRVLGDGESLNQSLEKAGRVDDFLESAGPFLGEREAELLQALVVLVQDENVLGGFRAIVGNRDELELESQRHVDVPSEPGRSHHRTRLHPLTGRPCPHFETLSILAPCV